MTPQRPPMVSVIEPINPAFEKVKTILFKPFDLGRWFVIGFCAWLAYLGKGGGGGGGGGRGGRASDIHEGIDQAKDFVLMNLGWIIHVVVVGVMLVMVLWLVFTWLSSRGRFMFLHCVAENKAEVKVPWAKFRQHGNSLFLFRIVLGLIGLAVIGVPVLLAVGCIAMITAGDGAAVIGVLGCFVIGLIIIALSIVWVVIGKFTTDFVVPIMFLRTTSCIAGWREFLRILSANKVSFLLYILFQIVIALVIFAIISMGFCIGLCFCCVSLLLLVPYIRTVILLPILVFTRSYSLFYLRQFGPEFDVFGPETQMVAAD